MIRAFLPLVVLLLMPSVSFAQHYASGIKIGEVGQTSAIVWVRLTKNKQPKFDLLKPKLDQPMPVDIVEGQEGEFQLKIKREIPNYGWRTVIGYSWIAVDKETDFTHQVKVGELIPNMDYRIEIGARLKGEKTFGNKITGSFKTAPLAYQSVPIRFIVTTCQACRSIDSGPDGHAAYAKMLDFKPAFFVHTGDILYYDKKPLAKTVDQARAKWHLMFGFGHNKAFHQNVASYFMKDDHDTLKNDCWPGQKYGDITFDQGLSIFREQVPMDEKTYRTVRWGKHVQIWLTENRDFRSPNTMEDGPEKTILGEEQKKWLMDGIAKSNATYKFVITPGPIVGPDKKGKRDNHSNAAFAHEGQQLRDFLSQQKNTFIICGDRHWQYCSKDPRTGLIEMGCGPINDQHNFGGDPGENSDFHRYFSNKGGFLGVTVEDGVAKAEWFGVNDADGGVLEEAAVLHTEKFGK